MANNFVYYDDALRILTPYANAIKSNRHDITALSKNKVDKTDLTNISETGTTASISIVKDTYFYLSGTLVQATQNISAGQSFVLNSNYKTIPNGALNDLDYDIISIDTKVPFKFGIDSNGNYGYFKNGSSIVTPFNSSLGVTSDPYIVEVSKFTLVTYYVDIDVVYHLYIPVGADILHPMAFVPSKDGYTFVGWRDDTTPSSEVLTNKTAEGLQMAVYAVFVDVAYTTTIYNASNTPDVIYSGTYYNNGNIDNPKITLSENAVSGWSKYGWTKNASGYTAEIQDGTEIEVISNETYYSLYSKDIVLTTYNASNTQTTSTKARYANFHSATTYSNPSWVLSENAMSGWNKAGWTNSTSGYSATIADGGTLTLTSNATYYSLYYKTISCSVHGSTKSTWPSWNTDYGNRVANVHSTTTIQNPTFGPYTEYSIGWTPRGWTTASSGGASSIALADGGTVTLSNNASYYACYYRTVTVSYNANGGSGTMGTSTGTAYYHSNSGGTNAAISIAGNGYTRSGYNFVQWHLNSTSGTAYAPGSTYSSTSDATMYAEWVSAKPADMPPFTGTWSGTDGEQSGGRATYYSPNTVSATTWAYNNHTQIYLYGPSISRAGANTITISGSFSREVYEEMSLYFHAYIDVSNDGSTWSTLAHQQWELPYMSVSDLTKSYSLTANVSGYAYIKFYTYMETVNFDHHSNHTSSMTVSSVTFT